MYRFELQLPDGTVISETAHADSWRWSAAFGAACMSVEHKLGLTPRSGIRCIRYEWLPAQPAPAN